MAITASLIIASQLKADEVWADSQVKKATIPHAEAAKAVLENQTSHFEFLTNKDKDLVAHVTWIDPCIGGVQDCTPKCVINGAGFNTLSQDYELDMCKDTNAISIGEEVFRKQQYTQEEVIAKHINQQLKSLDQWLAQQVLVRLKSFAGPNFFPNGYTQAGGTTYIPTNQYDVKLVPYLELAAQYNEMQTAYKISDGDFYLPWRNAQIYANDLNGRGAGMMAQEMADNLYFDLRNFSLAGLTEDMFLIEAGAFLFLTKSRFSTTPEYIDGTVNQWRWSQPSRQLPGVSYDFYMQKTCNAAFSSTQEDIVTNIQARVHAGMFQNPLGCTMTLNGVTGKTTGIISLTNGNAPA